MGFLDKLVEFATEQKERSERLCREKVQSMSDQQIISVLHSSKERPDWVTEILEAEARKRRLRY